MKYAYDVVLNFNDEFYNFYEWDTDDTIAYVKKIPIYKVTNDIINVEPNYYALIFIMKL